MRGSLFTFAAGRRAKWIVFAVWFVAIFIAAGPANLPGKFEDAESNEATSYLPGDAESTKALNGDRGTAERRTRARGDRLPPRVRPDRGRPPHDRRRRRQDDRESASRASSPTARPRPPAASRRGRAGRRRRSGLPPGCGGPTTTIPGQPADYAPFVGPICSEDGKAAIVTAYIKGNGEGERSSTRSSSGATRSPTRAAASR